MKKLGARSAREISRKLGARRPKVGLLRGRAALGGLFGDQQLSSLMDYIQGSIMLNYNDRAL